MNDKTQQIDSELNDSDLESTADTAVAEAPPAIKQKKAEDTAPAFDKGPGELLRITRESRKISQQGAAQKLNLNIDWIIQMEGNRYRADTALIYVRGHLRSYARLLDLPVDSVLAAFNRLGIEEKSEDFGMVKEQMPNSFVETGPTSLRKHGSKRGLKLILLAALLFIVAVVGTVYVGLIHHSNNKATAHQNTILLLNTASNEVSNDAGQYQAPASNAKVTVKTFALITPKMKGNKNKTIKKS